MLSKKLQRQILLFYGKVVILNFLIGIRLVWRDFIGTAAAAAAATAAYATAAATAAAIAATATNTGTLRVQNFLWNFNRNL